MEEVAGVIRKVIRNQMGFWYYLDIGITVRDNTIIKVIG